MTTVGFNNPAGDTAMLKAYVKTINGKDYVYLQGSIDGRKVTKYVGPLDEVVRVYLMVKAGELKGLKVEPRPGFEPGTCGLRGRRSGPSHLPAELPGPRPTLNPATLYSFRLKI